MQQALTQPEIRLRFIIKSLLLISVVLIVFHLFPNWMPERISGLLQDGYRLFSNGSMVQAVLLVLLMGLIIGDIRRFNQIIRVFICIPDRRPDFYHSFTWCEMLIPKPKKIFCTGLPGLICCSCLRCLSATVQPEKRAII